MKSLLTMGTVAKRFGVEQWQVRRLFESKRLPEPERVGAYRVVKESDLPRIEQALKDAGFLKSVEV